MRRRVTYVLVGAILAFGAPLGLLLAQAAFGPAMEWRQALGAPARDPITFGYVTLTTLLAFTLFGYLAGSAADRLQALSETDPLTGLANRRPLLAALQRDVAEACRYGQPLSLLVVDLDDLKSINDRLGHELGDQALRRVGEALRTNSRRADLAARMGGDEFALVAPQTPADAAVALAERIRGEVEEPGQEGLPGLSVSIGAATLAPPCGGRRADDLLRAADRALYQAKQRGRNRVAVGTVEQREQREARGA